MKHNGKSLDDRQHASGCGKCPRRDKETTIDKSSVGNSRRRFVKGTLAAAPVLMTVVSRPVWGNACAPSGMVSGNLSSPGADAVDCSTGLPPNDYVEFVNGVYELNLSNWPAIIDEDSYFDDVFETGPHTKLKQILKNTAEGTDPVNEVWEFDDFYRAAVAAYANAVSGRTSYLSPYMVICMVRDAMSGGYQVGSGITWSQDNVLAYFMYTWGEVA